MDNVRIFAGSASKELAQKVCNRLNLPLGEVELTYFGDGEFQRQFMENIRGCDIFIICSTHSPLENYWELFQMIDAARWASANKIIVVMPYYGYARQDRKDKPRVSVTSKLAAKFLQTAGASRIVLVDIHVDQILGYFDIPCDQVYASNIYIDYIKSSHADLNIVVASPDSGGTRRAHIS